MENSNSAIPHDPNIPYNCSVVGRCSICGGPVIVETVYSSVLPPNRRCAYCGAIEDPYANLPCIPMRNPNYNVVYGSGSNMYARGNPETQANLPTNKPQVFDNITTKGS